VTSSDDFAILWEANYQNVYTGLRKCGANHADAEDAVADAGLRAWKAFEGFDPLRASFRTWLGVIAFREWLRITHNAKRYIPLNEEAAYAAVFVEFEDSNPDQPTLTHLAAILLDTIRDRERALADQGQPPAGAYRVITEELLRRARAGMPCSQAAIARAVGVDRSTVCRCFALLRPALRECRSLTIGIPESPATRPRAICCV